MILVVLFLFPCLIGLIVSWLLDRDQRETKRREAYKKQTTSMTRFFVMRKQLNILCIAHFPKLKKNQIALVDETRCQLCLTKQVKPDTLI